MTEDDRSERDEAGFSEAAERSEGSPWVAQGINAVLSTLFALVVVGGLEFIGAMEFTLVNVATAAVVLFTISYIATR
ncbi:hypothetical protein LPA44_04575 [Halobacterium sp. KA-4]|uniref:hypothetical protein n=1 Tax=Halobacterium sp. KA-4 TaxID=2896367 RepID=UPI001E3DF996|nr:hypothetical protein [Halobacterium sp. KA-4]MCD2199175.1 hypothetical protein [Halobacterium sp. KA-4]